jgi:hypothetical protein
LRLARALHQGSVGQGKKAPYTVIVPSSRWQQVPAGVVSDGEEDLAFRASGAGAWVVTYVTPSPEATLDSLIDARRSVLGESNFTIARSSERRVFLPGAEFVPMSHATFQVTGAGSAGTFFVAVTIVDKTAVEVVGFAARASQDTDEVARFVSSLAAAKGKK